MVTMVSRNDVLGNAGAIGSAYSVRPDAPPEVPALESFRRQIERIHTRLTEAHEIADRSCGIRPPAPGDSMPTAAPNGLLDQIEGDLLGLEHVASALVGRLRRIAG